MQFLVEQARFLTEHFLTFDRKLKLFGTPIQCLREKSSFWQTNPDSWQKNPDFRLQKSIFFPTNPESRQTNPYFWQKIQIFDRQIHIFWQTHPDFGQKIQIFDWRSTFLTENPDFRQNIHIFDRTIQIFDRQIQILDRQNSSCYTALRFLFDKLFVFCSTWEVCTRLHATTNARDWLFFLVSPARRARD